jgi:hypothetical protein
MAWDISEARPCLFFLPPPSEHAAPSLNRIDEAVQRLSSDIKIARNIMTSRAQLPENILESLDGRAAPSIVEPAEAKTLGFVENILELSKTGANGMNVAAWNA